MRSLVLALMLASSFSVFAPTYAIASVPPEPETVSKDDALKVQGGVQELGALFGVDQPAPVKKEEVAPAKKTMADVADKALDKMTDIVGAISESMKNVAPEVWRIMLKQQYAKALGDLMVPLALTLLLYFVVVRKVKQIKDGEKTQEDNEQKSDYDSWCIAYAIAWIVFGMAALWLSGRFADGIKLLINPEYYAIQDLLRMLLTRSVQ